MFLDLAVQSEEVVEVHHPTARARISAILQKSYTSNTITL